VEKVVVNCGIGEASQNAKTLESTIRDIALITGQKAVVTSSRKAIAGFKLRQGVPVGVCLTLRGEVLPLPELFSIPAIEASYNKAQKKIV
jgi:large subunit ribosomal protein L5